MNDAETCRIGELFICKPDARRPAARLQIVLPPDRTDPTRIVCRVVKGVLIDLNGGKHGPGTLLYLPVDRVAAAIRRFQAKEKGQPLPPSTMPGSDTRVNFYRPLQGAAGETLPLFTTR